MRRLHCSRAQALLRHTACLGVGDGGSVTLGSTLHAHYSHANVYGATRRPNHERKRSIGCMPIEHIVYRSAKGQSDTNGPTHIRSSAAIGVLVCGSPLFSALLAAKTRMGGGPRWPCVLVELQPLPRLGVVVARAASCVSDRVLRAAYSPYSLGHAVQRLYRRVVAPVQPTT